MSSTTKVHFPKLSSGKPACGQTSTRWTRINGEWVKKRVTVRLTQDPETDPVTCVRCRQYLWDGAI